MVSWVVPPVRRRLWPLAAPLLGKGAAKAVAPVQDLRPVVVDFVPPGVLEDGERERAFNRITGDGSRHEFVHVDALLEVRPGEEGTGEKREEYEG